MAPTLSMSGVAIVLLISKMLSNSKTSFGNPSIVHEPNLEMLPKNDRNSVGITIVSFCLITPSSHCSAGLHVKDYHSVFDESNEGKPASQDVW